MSSPSASSPNTPSFSSLRGTGVAPGPPTALPERVLLDYSQYLTLLQDTQIVSSLAIDLAVELGAARNWDSVRRVVQSRLGIDNPAINRFISLASATASASGNVNASLKHDSHRPLPLLLTSPPHGNTPEQTNQDATRLDHSLNVSTQSTSGVIAFPLSDSNKESELRFDQSHTTERKIAPLPRRATARCTTFTFEAPSQATGHNCSPATANVMDARFRAFCDEDAQTA